MERLVGKRRLVLGADDFARLADPFSDILLDLGTGDGRFVDAMARQHPDMLAVGLDACREPLAERSRRAPHNAVFVIANALDLPGELDGRATRITIKFPWGSLLAALLAGDSRLIDRLGTLARPGARLEVRINAAAAESCSASLEKAAHLAQRAFTDAGCRLSRVRSLGPADLRAVPSTWGTVSRSAPTHAPSRSRLALPARRPPATGWSTR